MSTNLTGRVQYHGGPIVVHSTMYVIFWRPSGAYMDAKYESTIEQFLADVGDTAQYGILTQYYDRTTPIANASTFAGAWTDTSPYPADFDKGNSGDADLHSEVLKAVAVNHWPQGGATAIYAILTASRSPADKWAACAYHASFSSAGSPYVYTIVPYQHDYGPHGCGTPTNRWPNDRDADQTIDSLWHEQAESTSDPLDNNGAWYSAASGNEIADLCQTKYGPIRPNGSDTTLHGHDYITQEIWSDTDSECRQAAP
jgi:hypothetical protein